MASPLPEDDLEMALLFELVSAWRSLIDRRYSGRKAPEQPPDPWAFFPGIVQSIHPPPPDLKQRD